MKKLYLFFGFLFLVVGLIGLFVPLLPTTPFLLLTGFCFARSSPRFYSWLIEHPLLGPPIVAWQKHKAIAIKYKSLATLMMLGSSYFVFTKEAIPTSGKIAFGVFLILVLTFIWSRKSR